MSRKTAAKKLMNTTLVTAYVDRLEKALGDADRFEALMAALEADKNLRLPEVLQICKLFYGDARSGTSRREALRRIRARQDSLLDFKAKSRAQAGKSAA